MDEPVRVPTAYVEEDVALVEHADLPPLDLMRYLRVGPPEGSTAALHRALRMRAALEVEAATATGELPPFEALESHPLFAATLAGDAEALAAMEAEAADREAARVKAAEKARRAAELARRVEAERRAAAEAERAAQRERRLLDKELRRQDRLAGKKELAAKERAERQRRYDDLHTLWLATVNEKRLQVQDLAGQVSAAAGAAADVEERIAALVAEKHQLVLKLKEAIAAEEEAKKAQQQQLRSGQATRERGRDGWERGHQPPFGEAFPAAAAGTSPFNASAVAPAADREPYWRDQQQPQGHRSGPGEAWGGRHDSGTSLPWPAQGGAGRTLSQSWAQRQQEQQQPKWREDWLPGAAGSSEAGRGGSPGQLPHPDFRGRPEQPGADGGGGGGGGYHRGTAPSEGRERDWERRRDGRGEGWGWGPDR
jgi:hypothetical protein